MKKILTFLMASMMVLSLAACGSTDSAAGSENEADVTNDTTNDNTITESDTETSDAAYIEEDGKMVIGITIYEPMNYYDENGTLTGFDTEFAQAVCDKLGLEAEFVEINWDTKEIELNARSIDCIWNGMTIDEDRAANMSISSPYVKNAQVIVVKDDSDVTSTEALVGKTVVAEIGSAGEKQITGDDADTFLAQADYVGMSKQTDCLMEIKAGTADAAILDWTLAKTMVGEGTNFSDLKVVDGVELATEEYGVAFRLGSDMTEKVNTTMEELVADGTLPALAEKYGLTLAPAIAG